MGKEAAKFRSALQSSRLRQSSEILIIGINEASRFSHLSPRRICLAWHMFQFLPGTCGFGAQEHQVEVKAILLVGTGTMHAADHFGSCSSTLALDPCGLGAVPAVMLGNLLIPQLSGVDVSLVQLEPACERRVLARRFGACDYTFYSFPRIY